MGNYTPSALERAATSADARGWCIDLVSCICTRWDSTGRAPGWSRAQGLTLWPYIRMPMTTWLGLGMPTGQLKRSRKWHTSCRRIASLLLFNKTQLTSSVGTSLPTPRGMAVLQETDYWPEGKWEIVDDEGNPINTSNGLQISELGTTSMREFRPTKPVPPVAVTTPPPPPLPQARSQSQPQSQPQPQPQPQTAAQPTPAAVVPLYWKTRSLLPWRCTPSSQRPSKPWHAGVPK